MAKKKNNNKFLIILLLIIVLISGATFFSITGGATITSITRASFISESQDLNREEAYLIDLVVNQGGESLVATITPEALAQYGIEKVPEGDIELIFDLNSVSCNYQISDEEKPFYKIYQATARKSLCGVNCNDGCATTQPVLWDMLNLETVKKACRGEWGVTQRKTLYYVGETHNPEMCGKVFAPMGADSPSVGDAPDLTHCDNLVEIQTTPVRPDLGQQAGEWAYLMPAELREGWDGDHWRITHIAGYPSMKGYKVGTTATPKFSVDITIKNADGEIIKTTITDETTSANLGDIGRVKFIGSLLAQEFCPVPAFDYKVVEDTETNIKRVVERVKYEQYQDNLFGVLNLDNNYYQKVDADPGIGADVLWNYMSTLNALHRNLKLQDLQDECRLENNILVCSNERDVIYPELQLLLKADWVGVKINEGIPKIADVQIEKDVYEGDINSIQVMLANVGKATDSFDVGLKCNNMAVNTGNIRVPVEPNKVATINLNYVLDKGDFDCVITATSVNNPLATDTYDLSLTIKEKDFPVVEQCESVPAIPEANCLWQGYPICEWKCYDTESKELGMTIYLVLGLVIVGLSYAVYKKAKKGKKR